MAQAGLVGRCRRKKRRTTLADPEAKALDLVKRAFGPGTVLDGTRVRYVNYVGTWEGWFYVANVIDLASRRVVGWAIADHMRTELTRDALAMAIGACRPGPVLIFHSYRGRQCTSDDFTKLFRANRFRQSFPRPAQCWNNAIGESRVSTLKKRPRPALRLATRGSAGHLRVHPNVLHPSEAAFVLWNAESPEVRTGIEHRPARRNSADIIDMSVGWGQAQSPF
jgi:transposase InsO family protein